MIKTLLALGVCAGALIAQTSMMRTGQTNTTTGLTDMSGGDLTLPNHSSDPGTCAVGRIEVNTTGGLMKVCLATNTWSTVGGSITGGTCTNQAVTAINTSGVPTCTTLTSAYVNNSIALTGTDINTSNQVTTTHLASALPSAQGGTANAFFTVSGPATSAKTFTFPNASSTVLTDNAAVTVAQGGTGRTTLTNHGVLIGAGTSAITQLAAMAADTVLMGVASSDPSAVSVSNCGDSTHALAYSTSSHAFSCQSITGTANAPLTLTGSTDAVQLDVIGNSTQTNPIFRVKKSDGTVFLQVNNDGTVQAGNGSGPIDSTNQAAPGSAPASGHTYLWTDSTNLGSWSEDSSGNQYRDFKPVTCSNQVLTALATAGTGTCSTLTLASAMFANQGTTSTVLHGNGSGNPSFGAVALTDMATQGANTILGNVTGSTAAPTAAAAPSGGTSGCSGSTDAVIYTAGTGWGCHQITGGSGGGGVLAKTGNYTITSSEDKKLVTFDGSSLTATLPASPPSATFAVGIKNLNASALTVSRNGLTINGGTSNITLQQFQDTACYTDNSNWFCGVPEVAGSNITLTPASNGMTIAASGTGGDFSSNTSSSVDSEFVLFSGTGGKTGKRATGTGLARSASGVYSAAELSGDCTTSGSNAVTCTQINGSNFTVNSSGVPTKVGGITTVGQGVPTIGWRSVLTNSSATSLVTLATAPTAGQYEIHYVLDLHTACTTGTEQLSLAFGWTGNSARTLSTGNWNIGAAQDTTGSFSGVQPIYVASGNVTFTPTVGTACASGTATWDGLVWMTRVN